MSLAAVGLDLDYTLCAPDRNRARLLEEAVTAAGASPASALASRDAYQAAHREYLTGESREPIFAAMLEESSAEVDPAHLARAYRERVNEALRPVDALDELLRTLRRRYRVGLLTNGPRMAQRSKLRRLGLTDAFDAVCVSGELPAGKPDPLAFAALFEQLDVDPAELVYVGDDVEADVSGATAAGSRVIQVVRDDGPEPDPRAAAHVRLEAIADELPATLDALE